ncbi:MAG TPA: DUF3293 domain-containing protein [Planctomycetaceae bacterium]|nr:DUF3293 domain-containing protein [Planctomycetaceae bacterium]
MIQSFLTRLSFRDIYEATDYWVDDAPGGPFRICCGEQSPELDRALSEAGAHDWVYITACNPLSQALSDQENASRMLDLEARLRAMSCVVFHGRGVGRIGNWPAEPSLLVMGLSVDEGLNLGREFGQAAIVAGRRGEPARLAWTS